MSTNDWKPISTAPKDKAILIAGGTFDWDGSWGEDIPCKQATIVYWDKMQEGWRGDGSGGYDEYYWHKPTHWMPLPTVPKEILDEH
jgi:hypothetical protein